MSDYFTTLPCKNPHYSEMSDVRLVIKVSYEPRRRGDITVALTVLEFMDYEHELNTRNSRFMDHIQEIKR
jgi:hypothetical protein